MSKMVEIRREFQEPFVDVVKGFAAMRYSKRATAQILGFNLPYFRTILTRFDLHQYFVPQAEQLPECRGGGSQAGTESAKRPNNRRPRAYSDEYLLRLVAKHPRANDFQSSTMIYLSTVRRRFGSWRKARELAVNL